MLCARTLASHFERVYLVERDALPEGPIGRKGVPQDRHVHGFWSRGLELLDGLLPGLSQSLAEDGASTGDLARDLLWHQFGATKQQQALALPGMWMTRPFLESHVRRRVLELRFLQGYSLREAASALNVTISNIKVLQHRALRRAAELGVEDLA